MVHNSDESDRESELHSILSTLDDYVSRDGAWVQLSQYGGDPSEGKITGNRDGYRRLGIEFLKATLDADDAGFEVDLEYLISPESTINFDWFELSDPSQKEPPYGWFDRLIPIGCMATFVSAVAFCMIGVGTVLRWLMAR